jgi:hypothetical protein
VFVTLDMRAVLIFCPTDPFSIEAARFHTDRISSRIPWRHVHAAPRATTDINNDLLAPDCLSIQAESSAPVKITG